MVTSVWQRWFGSNDQQSSEIVDNVMAPDFIRSGLGDEMVAVMYRKIMHECADRASLPSGVKKESYTLTMNDSFSPAKRGLVNLVVHGMTTQSLHYYLKTKTSRGDYVFTEVFGEDAVRPNGTVKPNVLELDFTGFQEADVLAKLFEVLGMVTQAVGNSTAVSQAVIYKLHNLSEMIANDQNLAPLEHQMRQLNESISQGKAGIVDAKSSIEFAQVDVTPITVASEYIYSMISYLTGLPKSYLFGEVVGGLGDTSGSDEKRLNVALKRYFNSILSGVLWNVFGKAFQFKVIVEDLAEMVQMFTWVENSTILTEEGKTKLILDNTTLEESHIDTSLKLDEDVEIV